MTIPVPEQGTTGTMQVIMKRLAGHQLAG